VKIFGTASELVAAILRKNGAQYTINPPATDTVPVDSVFSLPDNPDAVDTLVLNNTAATLKYKTLDSTCSVSVATLPLTSANILVGNGSNIAAAVTMSGQASISNTGAVTLDNASVIGKVLTGLSTATTTDVVAADTILQGMGKLQGQLNLLEPQQVLQVAKAGAPYTSIQTAINAISDATAVKPYLIQVAPGVYSENIVVKDYVHIQGSAGGETQTTILVGTITGTLSGGLVALTDFTVNFVPSADNQKGVTISGGTVYMRELAVYVTGSGNFICTGMDIASSTNVSLDHVSVIEARTGSITANATGYSFSGTGSWLTHQLRYLATITRTSGAVIGINSAITGNCTHEQPIMLWNNAGVFTGSVTHFSYSVANDAGKNRITNNAYTRMKIASGTGTATFSTVAGTSANTKHVGCAILLEGFSSANRYYTNTAATCSQQVWLNSANVLCNATGTGIAVITPCVEKKSGFTSWETATGTTYWTYVPGTKIFTVLNGGAGVVRDSAVVWAPGQAVTLSADNTMYYIYIDSTGALQFTDTASEALYTDNIVLFEIYSDGTNYLVTKENHPYGFSSLISYSWHRVFGPLLSDGSGVLAVVGAPPGAATPTQTVSYTGSMTLDDHGVATSISTTSPLPFTFLYTSAAGKLATYSTGLGSGVIPCFYNNAGTPTNIGVSSTAVVRLGVLKDTIKSASPQWVALLDTAGPGQSLAQAQARVAAGQVAAFPPELKALEIAQVGYAYITRGNGGGNASLTVQTALQVFGAQFIGSAVAASAALITTNTAAFTKILSAADVTVQAALDTLDAGAAKKAASSTDNAIARFDSTTGQLIQNSVVTVGDSGEVAGVSTLAVSTSISLEDPGAGTFKMTQGAPTLGADYSIVWPTGAGTTGQFLKTTVAGTVATLSWDTPSGAGDVVGPATNTANAIALFNGTNSKTIKNSSITSSDGAALTGITTLSASASVSTPSLINGTSGVNIGPAASQAGYHTIQGMPVMIASANSRTSVGGPASFLIGSNAYYQQSDDSYKAYASINGYSTLLLRSANSGNAVEFTTAVAAQTAGNALTTGLTILSATHAGAWTFPVSVSTPLAFLDGGSTRPILKFGTTAFAGSRRWQFITDQVVAGDFNLQVGTTNNTTDPTVSVMSVTPAGAWTLGPTSGAAFQAYTGSGGATFGYDTTSTYLSILPEDANGTVVLKFGATSGAAPGLQFKQDNGTVVLSCAYGGAWTWGAAAGGSYQHTIYGASDAGAYTLRFFQGSGTGATKYFIVINSLDGVSQNYASVTWNGSATVWGTTSDRRKKENIVASPDTALSVVRRIEVNSFNIIGCESTQTFGYIAQQLAPLVPNAVSCGDDSPTWNKDSVTWNVDYGQVSAVHTKAIQELAAELDSLRSHVAALQAAADAKEAK
jgi:Chaperone of endosialidase